jgi:plastocyanin
MNVARTLAGLIGVALAATPALGAGGECRCNISVIAGATGISVTGGGVRGPCGREMAPAKVVATQVFARGAAATALSGPVSFPGDVAAAEAVHEAAVFDTDYDPDPLVINAGDTVHWSWLSGTHSVTTVSGAPESFNSGLLSQGQEFSHTFMVPGRYVYYCQVHGLDLGNGTAIGMIGFVTVRAVPEPAGTLAVAAVAILASRRRSRG